MKKLFSFALLLLLLLAAACGGAETEPVDTGAEDGGETAVTETGGEETAVEEGPGTYLARAEAGEFSGEKVIMFGVWVDEDQRSFDAAVAPFEERTGIDVEFEGSSDFETLIQVRVEGGDPPDIAVFPQPGLMANLSRAGHIVDHSQILDTDQLNEDFIQSWIDLATVDGKLSGVWYRASTKSLVWYPVAPFEAAGYTVPETWAELQALQDEMVANGHTPWCIGIESSGATGWVATDWVEDIMLRTAGPDAYDQWVTHEIPFTDPQVREAVETMGEIWLNPDYVLGGSVGIITTPVGDAPLPMFDEPEPNCWLHRQAGWISAFFPDSVDPATDTAFFYFPPIDEALGKPVLGAGDIASAFNDRPAVRAVMEYLATAESAQGWIERGGFISPHNGVPLDWYPNELDRQQAEIMQQATVFRFDASDQMPGAVGAGSFWNGMVDYVNGTDLDTVLPAIDADWPE